MPYSERHGARRHLVLRACPPTGSKHHLGGGGGARPNDNGSPPSEQGGKLNRAPVDFHAHLALYAGTSATFKSPPTLFHPAFIPEVLTSKSPPSGRAERPPLLSVAQASLP